MDSCISWTTGFGLELTNQWLPQNCLQVENCMASQLPLLIIFYCISLLILLVLFFWRMMTNIQGKLIKELTENIHTPNSLGRILGELYWKLWAIIKKDQGLGWLAVYVWCCMSHFNVTVTKYLGEVTKNEGIIFNSWFRGFRGNHSGWGSLLCGGKLTSTHFSLGNWEAESSS